MANRRHGQGRPYYNVGGGGNVNPWQGGAVPGGGGTTQRGFNSMNPTSLLSQLSEPQAQLALALSKLLQPQQQVPSLLTMDTINPLQNRNYHPNNDFRARMNMNRRPDFRRNEPYNKMNNRNSRGNDRRRGDRSNKSTDRKVQAHRTTVVAQLNKNSSAKSSPSSTKSSAKSEPKAEVKTEAADNSSTSTADEKANANANAVNDTDDGVKREDQDSEVQDKKRDWKEEKTSEESVKVEENEVVEIKDEDGDEKADEKEPENKKEEIKVKKSGKYIPYAGIPRNLLHCHICKKSMWDGESFEKHMNGRAHQQMFHKVEESYMIKADMMREAIRLSEEKNNIEMERMKRSGKKMKHQQLNHCAMCDLDFYGQMFAHRKLENHQKLKHFLHPRCDCCNKEFPTRMEWENHRHTLEHLRKEAQSDKKKDKSVEDNDVLLEEENDIILDIADEEDADESNIVTEVCDEVTEKQIPVYKPTRAVGSNLITSVTGFFCEPCSRFFLTEEASQKHARSKQHYNSFVGILNEKVSELEEKKRKAVNEEEEDDEGNWKRRKVAKDDEAEEIKDEEGEEGKDEEGEEDKNEEDKNEADESKMEEGSELYDPADSFLSSADPNDICLETSLKNKTEDEVWKEVDQQLDEILDPSQKEDKDSTSEKTESEKSVSPVAKKTATKTTPTPGPRRTPRAKRN